MKHKELLVGGYTIAKIIEEKGKYTIGPYEIAILIDKTGKLGETVTQAQLKARKYNKILAIYSGLIGLDFSISKITKDDESLDIKITAECEVRKSNAPTIFNIININQTKKCTVTDLENLIKPALNDVNVDKIFKEYNVTEARKEIFFKAEIEQYTHGILQNYGFSQSTVYVNISKSEFEKAQIKIKALGTKHTVKMKQLELKHETKEKKLDNEIALRKKKFDAIVEETKGLVELEKEIDEFDKKEIKGLVKFADELEED